MGAESRVDFLRPGRDGASAREAYERAVEDARYESGSGGYTGSIAESRGFLMAGSRPLLKWEAQQMGEELIALRKVDKWGPCMLVPVAEATGARGIELEVDVTGLEDWGDIRAKAAGVLRSKMRDGEEIEDLRIEDGERKDKIVATTTKGTAVSKYAIANGNHWHYFETLTAARKWATETLQRNRFAEEFRIVKLTVRDSNEPLAVVRRVPVKVTKKVTAKVGRPGGRTVGWMAAGVYSC